MIIKCRKCQNIKEKSTQSGNICLDCYKEYQRQYRKKNIVKLQEYYKERQDKNRQNPQWVNKQRKRGREYWAIIRHQVFMAYGGYICVCCGETEPMFLTIDHINNDGASHRRQLGYSGNGKGGSSRTWKWLKDNNYPDNFQVLCMNCNHGKFRNKGTCPHHNSSIGVNRVKSVESHSTGEYMGNTEPSPIYREGVTTILKESTSKRTEAHGTLDLREDIVSSV